MTLTGGTEIASKASLEGIVFTGDNLPSLTNSGSNCFVGKKFGTGQVGVLESFRFFMDYFQDVSVYAGALTLQGSNDDFVADINDLVVVGEELHEGWNYYDLASPSYNAYRLFNANNNGCNKIGHIKFIGQEVFDIATDPATLQVGIVDTATSTETALSTNVVYSLAKTNHVLEMTPRWGSVEGGTQVTITTTDLGATTQGDVTVLIDGIECQI